VDDANTGKNVAFVELAVTVVVSVNPDRATFKLLTRVVDVMVIGAEPSATVFVYTPEEARVVNAPEAGVAVPIVPLSAPPVEVSVEKAPVLGITEPIDVLLIVPPLIVAVPIVADVKVPVAFASVTPVRLPPVVILSVWYEPDVKIPDEGVVPPIGVLLIVLLVIAAPEIAGRYVVVVVTFVPSLQTTSVAPFGIVTPVLPTALVLITIDWLPVVPFLTMYILVTGGAITLRVPVIAPVKFRYILRD
jgi:hypothetical protein